MYNKNLVGFVLALLKIEGNKESTNFGRIAHMYYIIKIVCLSAFYHRTGKIMSCNNWTKKLIHNVSQK